MEFEFGAMKPQNLRMPPAALATELLILSDGRVLTHRLTPALARLLQTVNPRDSELNQRLTRGNRHGNESPTH